MITSQTLSIVQILSDVYNGRIRIPDFQRSPVWDANDVEMLLDSIYRGYPLGSFLLWETNFNLKERNPLELSDRPGRPERQYLIDGQQRTISLYGIFTDSLRIGEEPKHIDYRAYFNLENESFSLYKKTEISRNPDIIKEVEIPLHEALNFDLTRRVVSASNEIQSMLMEKRNIDLMNHFQQLRNTFTSYIVAGVLVQGVGLDEACEIFVRMNKSGVALNIVDLMVARTYSATPYFNLREELEQFNSINAPRGYQLKDSTILYCISTCLEGGIQQRNILASAEENKLNDNWDNCLRAINASMDFLQNEMVKISNFLPNEVILAPISYYFYNKRRPNASNLTELKNFFWGASITQRYIQGQTSRVREDIENMNRIIEDDIIPIVEHTVNTDDVLYQKLRLGSSFCKSILCLLSTYNPRDWLTDQTINLVSTFSTANARQFHHIFPKRYLRGLSSRDNYEFEIKPLVDSVANICILTALSNNIVGSSPPSEYIRNIEDENNNILETLSTHLISEEAYERLINDDFLGFINIRSRDIVNELNRKLDFDSFRTDI